MCMYVCKYVYVYIYIHMCVDVCVLCVVCDIYIYIYIVSFFFCRRPLASRSSSGASGAPGGRRVLRTPRIVRAAPKLARSRHNDKPVPWKQKGGPAVGHGGANSCTHQRTHHVHNHRRSAQPASCKATLQARLGHPTHGGTGNTAAR